VDRAINGGQEKENRQKRKKPRTGGVQGEKADRGVCQRLKKIKEIREKRVKKKKLMINQKMGTFKGGSKNRKKGTGGDCPDGLLQKNKWKNLRKGAKHTSHHRGRGLTEGEF